MSRVKTPFKCLCGHEQDVVYKKPSLFSPTPVSVTCNECESIYFVKFKKDPKLAAGMIGIETRVDFMSDLLKNALATRECLAKEELIRQNKAQDAFLFGEPHVKTS